MHASLFFAFLFAAGATSAQELSSDQIGKVKARLAEVASASWEHGARAEALLEYDVPQLSVFSSTPIPPPSSTLSSLSSSPSLGPITQIARDTVQSRPAGTRSLVNDGSAADPASIGVAVVIANLTKASGADFRDAAFDEIQFLLSDVPRSSDGAISHKRDTVQLWSDSVYMVPPFLAYYGAVTNNKTLMDEAYTQIRLYRDHLHDSSAGGKWKHIVLGGDGEDSGYWSTGNGWAAMGMLRTLAAFKQSSLSSQMSSQSDDLVNWIGEILDGMWPHLRASNLFHNYPDRDSSFDDASSTALLAATTYRYALLAQRYAHVPQAEKARKEISKNRVDDDGWLSPVVNPHNFPQQGSHSPEGQAFVISMQAAYRDWVQDGKKGENAAAKLKVNHELIVFVMITFVAMLVI